MSDGARVDPGARIDATAQLGEGVRVGVGAVIGAHAVLGPGCRVEPYGVVGPHTALGSGCHVFSFAVVGAAAQDRHTDPDAPHRLVCGADNRFREGVTVSRGTAHGGGETRLGDGNLLMAHSHVGHDCRLGDHNTLANGVSLAGHVEVGDRVTLGGHAGVHQFVRVGDLALVAANAMVSRDVPPYCIAAGDRATARGLNVTGLRRAGLSSEVRGALKRAFRAVLRSPAEHGGRRAAAEARLRDPVPEVAAFAAFVLGARRGVIAPRR